MGCKAAGPPIAPSVASSPSAGAPSTGARSRTRVCRVDASGIDAPPTEIHTLVDDADGHLADIRSSVLLPDGTSSDTRIHRTFDERGRITQEEHQVYRVRTVKTWWRDAQDRIERVDTRVVLVADGSAAVGTDFVLVVVARDANGHPSRIGQLTSSATLTTPEAAERAEPYVESSYDANGRLLEDTLHPASTMSHFVTRRWSYDEAGHVVRREHAASGARARRSSRTRFNALYDGRGRLVHLERERAPFTGIIEDAADLDYDEAGHVIAASSHSEPRVTYRYSGDCPADVDDVVRPLHASIEEPELPRGNTTSVLRSVGW